MELYLKQFKDRIPVLWEVDVSLCDKSDVPSHDDRSKCRKYK